MELFNQVIDGKKGADMVAGGYALDLYCENAGEDWFRDGIHNGMPLPARYTGESGKGCHQQARREGWVLDLKVGKAWCPECMRLGLTGAHIKALTSSESNPRSP